MTEQELEHRMTAVEDRSKSNTRRLNEVEVRQGQLEELITSVALIARRQETLEKDVGEMKEDVKTLVGKPGKRWEGLVEKGIAALAGAFLAWILAM